MKVLWAVQLADIGSGHPNKLDLGGAILLWGPIRTSYNHKVLWSTLKPGHQVPNLAGTIPTVVVACECYAEAR